jgi:hypothetical protein
MKCSKCVCDVSIMSVLVHVTGESILLWTHNILEGSFVHLMGVRNNRQCLVSIFHHINSTGMCSKNKWKKSSISNFQTSTFSAQ